MKEREWTQQCLWNERKISQKNPQGKGETEGEGERKMRGEKKYKSGEENPRGGGDRVQNKKVKLDVRGGCSRKKSRKKRGHKIKH